MHAYIFFHIVDVCPRGFFSRKGLPPCKRCPVDTYSASPSLCSDCPNGKSTVGIDGAIDVSACIGTAV